MGIISGQDAKLEVGIGDTWGQSADPTCAVEFTSEDLKFVPVYKAEDATSLDAALKAISQQAASCVLKLKKVPAELDNLHVYFDKVTVPQDKAHKEGWDFDPATNQLTFYGKPCSEIEGNLVSDIRILYGCTKPTEPPGPKTCASGTTCTVKEDCPAKSTCLAGCCVNVIE